MNSNDNAMEANTLTITYLTRASFASLNGSDKEADNISNIKKIQMADGLEYPYRSAQAIRRDLREQLAALGEDLSEGMKSEISKGASSTAGNPQKYIDDDLFGFMIADKITKKRTSPVRVSPLISLEPYRGELDFATNFMGVKAGGDPNIFESEIHSGCYRGTILIELDRIGEKEIGGNYELKLNNGEKKRRVSSLLDAIQNLWGIGRQSRFLADISPKFVVAGLLKVKNPIFLECLRMGNNGVVDEKLIKSTLDDFSSIVIDSVLGERKGFFPKDTEEALPIGQAFAKMKGWLDNIKGYNEE